MGDHDLGERYPKSLQPTALEAKYDPRNVGDYFKSLAPGSLFLEIPEGKDQVKPMVILTRADGKKIMFSPNYLGAQGYILGSKEDGDEPLHINEPEFIRETRRKANLLSLFSDLYNRAHQNGLEIGNPKLILIYQNDEKVPAFFPIVNDIAGKRKDNPYVSISYMREIPFDIEGLNLGVKIANQTLINCPNPKHLDNHPSCLLNSQTRKYYCLACGAKGLIGPTKEEILLERIPGFLRYTGKSGPFYINALSETLGESLKLNYKNVITRYVSSLEDIDGVDNLLILVSPSFRKKWEGTEQWGKLRLAVEEMRHYMRQFYPKLQAEDLIHDL